MAPISEPENPEVLHSMSDMSKPLFTKSVLLILFVVAVLGVGSGYMLSGSKAGSSSSPLGNLVGSGASKGTVEGSDDMKTFKDTTEGVVTEGGIDGEGQFHLVRPGGVSQSVYMTSSIVDLSKYMGKKVKVWGQTQASTKAGWLMDVGRVQVLE